MFALSFGFNRCSHLPKAFLREEGGPRSGGRSLRDHKDRVILALAHSPPPDFIGSSLPEGAFEKIAAVLFVLARNVVRTIFRLRTNKRSPINSVGGDVLDAPQRCSHYLTATRRILINVCMVWFGMPPCCLFLPVVFMRAIRESPLRFNKGMRFAAIVFCSCR